MTLDRYEYHPEALDELIAAAEWYELRKPGLGGELQVELDRAIALILELPTAAPRVPRVRAPVEVRQAKLRRFPYRVVYLVRDCVAVILAVAHVRRRPGYWLDRLPRR